MDVTVGELNLRAERLLYRGIVDRTDRYRIALREAIGRRLKGLDFFRLGYNEDPAFAETLGPRYAEELLIAYYEKQYEEPYLNEESIREQYEAMGRVVQYRQIVLRKPAGATSEILDGLRATVEDIRRQLDGGVAVETLVERYSEDERSAAVGGLMPPVTWEQSTGSALGAVTFRLEPGEAVSLETDEAFVIAVGERVGEQPRPPFGAVADRLAETLRGRYAQQANEAYYRERQALVDSASVRWNGDALDQIVAWSRTPDFFQGGYREVVGDYLRANGDDIVFTDSAGELRMSDLTRLLSSVLTVSGQDRNRDREFVRDFLLEAVRADRMADLAIGLGLRDQVFRPNTSSPVIAGAYERYYDSRLIEARLPDTTEVALRDFYQAHDDSLFYQLATVYTEAVERETEAEIDEVWAQVQDGAAFSDVSSRVLIRGFERTRDGEIVSRFSREPPYWGELAFGLSEGEVAGPVAYDTPEGRRYAVVRVTRRLDERQLAFEEVRSRVVEAFMDHHRERLAQEVDAELRARYSVEVNEEVMDALLNGQRTGAP